jgi:hypothetical protein
MKSKGGFFRSKRHIKIYIEEHGIEKWKKVAFIQYSIGGKE